MYVPSLLPRGIGELVPSKFLQVSDVETESRRQNTKMKITIVYDNQVYKAGLKADWGFSCLVEVEGTPWILFDTGAHGDLLLQNMRNLNIDPGSIQTIFISHPHHDHTGGLFDLLRMNRGITVYVPASYALQKAEGEIIKVKKSVKIYENVFSTGELSDIEHALVIATDKGLVVIAGCSHPGVGAILQAARGFGKKVHALIGGLHGFKEVNLLEDLDLVCPTHCTQYGAMIKRRYPQKYVAGGAGRIIEL